MSNKNRGMFLESIVNKTINFLNKNNICMLHKKEIPIKFSKVRKNEKDVLELDKAFISKKSTTDYYGIYKGTFVAFEAKSTDLDYLPIQNIQKHQQEYLLKIKSLGGAAFYIVCFKNTTEFFILNPEAIKNDTKKLELTYFRKNCFTLDFEYPGLLNITEYLELGI